MLSRFGWKSEGEVFNREYAISGTSRETAYTPTTGKKVRVVAIEFTAQEATPHLIEVYYGTRTRSRTITGKTIAIPFMHLTEQPNGGRIYVGDTNAAGAVDDVVSLRSTVILSSPTLVVLHMREE